MKKEFLTPSMEISVFDQNDVLTTASSATNKEVVTGRVTGAIADAVADYKGSIAEISLTF